ncbi:MAG: alanine--tRNA ligase, partial [Angelakisella sp.]
KLGLFRILKESSVAAGIRRIEATTGLGVLRLMEEEEAILHSAAAALKAGSTSELPERVTAVAAELKAKEKELDIAQQKLADFQMSGLYENAKDINGIYLICAAF